MKFFTATKAFITHQGKVLILKESPKNAEGTNAGKYDVVGGRIIPGEHFTQSLLREVREETGLTVNIGKPFFVSEWRPIVKGEPWQIIGIFFECTTPSNTLTLSHDHDAYEWIHPQEYKKYALIGNLPEVFEAYLNHKNNTKK